jgi:hypothetical protein
MQKSLSTLLLKKMNGVILHGASTRSPDVDPYELVVSVNKA